MQHSGSLLECQQIRHKLINNKTLATKKTITQLICIVLSHLQASLFAIHVIAKKSNMIIITDDNNVYYFLLSLRKIALSYPVWNHCEHRVR